MTDFVVSRVAMSVCALMVAGGLAGIVETSFEPDPAGELEAILADLQEAISRLMSHGGGSTLSWTVPALPSGATVHMSFRDGTALARSESASRTIETRPELHTWAWDGLPTNRTTVEELDAGSQWLDAWTGQPVSISTSEVLVEDIREVLVFVR